jgi:hypothetical protein
MASFVSTDGLLKVLDAVRREFPAEMSTKIISGILQLVRECGTVVVLRYDRPPVVDANSIVKEFIDILNMKSVDGTRNLKEHMLTVCADVDGLLFTQCATRWASVLLAEHGEGMVLCGGSDARRCAEKFYDESRRAYRFTKPMKVFPSRSPYGAISRLGTQGPWVLRRNRYDAAVAAQFAGGVYKSLNDLLTMPEVTVTGPQLKQAMTDCLRERLCLAVFPGTRAAYDQPIGDVLRSACAAPPSLRSWGEPNAAEPYRLACSAPQIGRGWRKPAAAKPYRVVAHDDDPFHRFWCWTVDVLNAASQTRLEQLVAEAAAHRELFDQIAFEQCAYGDYRLVVTWQILREYAYRYGCNRANVPACWLDSPPSVSAFRLVSIAWWSARSVRQLFAVCNALGGHPLKALLADECVYDRWNRLDSDLALRFLHGIPPPLSGQGHGSRWSPAL